LLTLAGRVALGEIGIGTRLRLGMVQSLVILPEDHGLTIAAVLEGPTAPLLTPGGEIVFQIGESQPAIDEPWLFAVGVEKLLFNFGNVGKNRK